MTVMKEFFASVVAALRNELQGRVLPTVRLEIEEEKSGDITYAVFNSSDVRVGRVAISLWLDQPMLYLTLIEFDGDYQKKGFGTATLVSLTLLHRRRIVPVQQSGKSTGFWEKVRRRSGDNFIVDEQVSTTTWSLITRKDSAQNTNC